jgi:hypothetical protein
LDETLDGLFTWPASCEKNFPGDAFESVFWESADVVINNQR